MTGGRQRGFVTGALRAPVRALLGIAATLLLAGSAAALNDLGGQPIANSAPGAQLVTGPTITALRGTPFSAPALPQSPNSPEEDLLAALDDIANAADLTAANTARDRALAILQGGSVPGAAYDGIGLLNHSPAGKTKVVPAANPIVDVRLVRFGEHQISDTWLLDLSQLAPTQGFVIRYTITELGGAEGGDLTTTPLLHDGGTPIGGVHSVVTPLGLGEELLGTTQFSRFTNALGGGVQSPEAEHTRIATQTVQVRMPPQRHVSVVLDPNLRPDHEALSVLRPAAGVTPPPVTVADLAPSSPERQIFDDLQTPFADVGDANGRGATLSQLVAPMRVKTHLPPGPFNAAGVDLAMVFMNNEVYVSRTSLRLVPNDPSFTVRVYNEDGFAHNVQGLGLDGQQPVLGATTWGQFGWNVIGSGSVAPGTSQVVTFTPTSTAFAAVIGDPDSGDQARSFVTLDRDPDQQSFKIPSGPPFNNPSFAFPLHGHFAADGSYWFTLAGVDKIGRLVGPIPDDLSTATYQEFTLPPPPAFAIAWEPVDIQVDSQGIVWATLAAGNAVMRLDPAQAQPGTDNGVEIIPLDVCPEEECRQPPPPAPVELSREPTQLTLRETPLGTEVWFTELLADKIGVVRWGGSVGSSIQRHYSCACKVPSTDPPFAEAGNPSGIDVDAAGNIWFAGANRNTVAKLVPPANLSSSVAAVTHYNIPSAENVVEPEIGGAFFTSAPHSVDVDDSGRVWFTELLLHKVGYLEPWNAVPNTTVGMHEIELGRNAFGSLLQPADLTVDRAGTAYLADEYGDEITAVTRCGVQKRYRPTARLSFTDQPIVDPAGNLWFLEAGANMITRLRGIAPPASQQNVPDSGAGCPPPPGGGGGGVGQPQPVQPPVTPQPPNPLAVACAKRHWAYGTQQAPKVLLLGFTQAQVTSCLGRPSSKKAGIWTYGTRIRVTFAKGRVSTFTLTNAAFRSAVGNVGVGSRVGVLGRVSRARLVFNRAASTYTAMLPLSTTQRARVQYVTARGKVTRIVVTAVKR